MTRSVYLAVGLAATLYIVSVAGRVLGFFLDVLVVVFSAWVISVLIRGIADRTQGRIGIPRWAALTTSYLLVLLPLAALAFFVVPVAVAQALQLARNLPAILAEAPSIVGTLQDLADALGVEVDLRTAYQTDMRTQIGHAASGWVRDNALAIAQSTVGAFFQGLFIAGLSFYFVVDAQRIGNAIYRMLPGRWHPAVRNVYASMESIFSRWLAGILVVALLYGLATYIVMTVAGLPYAVPISLIAGLFVVLPYFGDAVAVALPTTVALAQHGVDGALVLAITLATFDLVVLNLLISPRLFGRAVRMPAAFVLLSVLITAKLLGPLSAIFAVPLGGLAFFTMTAVADRLNGRTAVLGEDPVSAEAHASGEAAPAAAQAAAATVDVATGTPQPVAVSERV